MRQALKDESLLTEKKNENSRDGGSRLRTGIFENIKI
jgi:hypothetical protein